MHVQADESGTELHVSADEVEVEVPAPRAKGRKRAGKPAMIEIAEEAVADASEEATLGAAIDDGHVAEAVAAGAERDATSIDGVGDFAFEAGADPADRARSDAADDRGEGAFDAADDLGDGAADAVDGSDGVFAAGDEHGEADASAGATDEIAAEGDEIAGVMPTSAASLDPKRLRHLVEALVFAADKPITVQRLRQLTRVADVGRLEAALAELAVDYQDRGVILQQVSGGYQFRTQTRFSAWVQQLIQGRPVRLSRAQLETLAIVAYRQPITRPEIDDIRGVDSSATLKLLLDRALIRILGKREEVGRPMLYGTTKEFLDFFSLGDLRELPTLREYSELTDESRRVMKDRLGGGEPEGGSTPPSSDDDGGAPPPADDGGGEPASAAGHTGAADVDARATEHDHGDTGEHADRVDVGANDVDLAEHDRVDTGEHADRADMGANDVDPAEPQATGHDQLDAAEPTDHARIGADSWDTTDHAHVGANDVDAAEDDHVNPTEHTVHAHVGANAVDVAEQRGTEQPATEHDHLDPAEHTDHARVGASDVDAAEQQATEQHATEQPATEHDHLDPAEHTDHAHVGANDVDAAEPYATEPHDHLDAAEHTDHAHVGTNSSDTTDHAQVGTDDGDVTEHAHADAAEHGEQTERRGARHAHVGDDDGRALEDGEVVDGDARWPHGSMRMAAVTPVIELVPKAEEPTVDAHVVRVLEGVAADSGEPTQE